MKASPKSKPKYTIIKDSREQKGWDFPETDYCAGTVVEGLKVADYSIDGLTDKFLIERKATPSELAGNLTTKDETRFRKELEKLNKIKHAYLILEFTLADLLNYPWSDNSLPISVKKRIRVSGRFLVAKLYGIQLDYPNIQFIFAGRNGSELATILFKQIFRLYDNN